MKFLFWLILSGSVAAQTLLGLDGHKVSLEELRRGGKPLVLMTWCSHCACCRSGEKTLLELSRRYPEVEMHALDAQFGDDARQVKAYLGRQKLSLSVLFDPRGGLCRVMGIRTSTTALLWDKRGEMRYFGNLAGLERAITQVCTGQAVAPPTTPQQGCPILFLEHLDKMDRP